MTKNQKSEKVSISLENLKQACSRLDMFLSKPIEDERDEAGVIQAFEFTYELFWKIFQKIAQEQGFQAASPKQALKAAFQLNLILSEEEDTWLEMLDDRNRTVHTYLKELAKEVFIRIQDQYHKIFNETLDRLVNYTNCS